MWRASGRLSAGGYSLRLRAAHGDHPGADPGRRGDGNSLSRRRPVGVHQVAPGDDRDPGGSGRVSVHPPAAMASRGTDGPGHPVDSRGNVAVHRQRAAALRCPPAPRRRDPGHRELPWPVDPLHVGARGVSRAAAAHRGAHDLLRIAAHRCRGIRHRGVRRAVQYIVRAALRGLAARHASGTTTPAGRSCIGSPRRLAPRWSTRSTSCWRSPWRLGCLPGTRGQDGR